ncbi:MAG: OmpA family protein [Bdellovibrionales bacterium]|nr:OmpA family protein [Bdellovibrionales bacterium]
MALKKKHEEHENHERWLVSYADFITLLFAFFVVLYATSNKDQSKAKEFEDSVREHMNLSGPGEGGSKIFSHQTHLGTSFLKKGVSTSGTSVGIDTSAGSIKDPTMEAIKNETDRNRKIQLAMEEKQFKKNLATIYAALKEEIENGKIKIARTEQTKSIIIRFEENISFPVGKADIQDSFQPILKKLASVLLDVKGRIQVAGHTDDQKLPPDSEFKNNWALSSARANAVVEQLVRYANTLEERVIIESYGATKPIAKNDSIYNRAKNRRIEIIVTYGL